MEEVGGSDGWYWQTRREVLTIERAFSAVFGFECVGLRAAAANGHLSGFVGAYKASALRAGRGQPVLAIPRLAARHSISRQQRTEASGTAQRSAQRER